MNRGFPCKDRDRVVYLLRWLASTCNVPFHGALGEPEDTAILEVESGILPACSNKKKGHLGCRHIYTHIPKVKVVELNLNISERGALLVFFCFMYFILPRL